MNAIRAMGIGALALAMACGWARATAIPGEDLFKWGEYDSLIRLLEPVALRSDEAPSRSDSLIRAKSLLFLGVAFCATGQSGRADTAFSRAVALDPRVELDRFYVTEAIANRFQATALRAYRQWAHAPPAATAVAAQRPAAPQPSKPAAPASAALAPPSRHGWLWLGMGAAALAAAGGGYFLLQSGQDAGPRETVTRVDLGAE